jgi:XTP/dITP diphosphohydrolase
MRRLFPATADISTTTLVIASRNPGKIREIRHVLAGLPLKLAGLEGRDDIPEPEETGETFAENARAKALYYARAAGQWCLADDSGLEVDALGGAPGVHSARYAAADCPPAAGRAAIDAANNAKLLKALADVPPESRTGRFVCHMVLADPQDVLLEACDVIEGQIGYEPRGQNGFGYDPLFCLPELGCTTAELPEGHKNQLSHRGKALRRIVEMLREAMPNW